jgi:hypothetical protein
MTGHGDMSIIPARGKLRQEDHKFEAISGLHSEFQASLGYLVTLTQKI